MKSHSPRESGQILVIMAFALVAMVGLTALAVDGGMVYADRRFSQSASDTASMVGAGAAAQYLEINGINWEDFTCDNSTVVDSYTVAFNAAKNAAANNQFQDLDNNLGDKHGIEVLCVNDPDHFEKYIDVHTMITSTVKTSFIQLFYTGPVRNTVNSVARIHPRTQLGFGNAIVGLSSDCGSNDGVYFTGSATVNITGGGVFSNSCISASGSINVDVDYGGIEYISSIIKNGSPELSPDPIQKPKKMPIMPITPPGCGTSAPVASQGSGTLTPGNYSKIKLSNGDLTLSPGLYCLTGDMDIEGGTLLGDGVTIYLLKDGIHDTNVTINGNVTVHLNAPNEAPVNGAMTGVLFYMADGNGGNINLQGTADSSFAGAIYSPNGSIDVGGTSDVNPTYNTQLIGNYVKVHGNADIDINYNGFIPHTEAPKLDMRE